MHITLDSPLDMHLHLREGDMLQRVAPLSAAYFSGAVIMPNLITPVDSFKSLTRYLADIRSACGIHVFEPYMTLFFRQYSRTELEQCRDHIIGIKLYPAGVTTQSESGVTDFGDVEETIALMQELQIPLLVHGETSGFVLDREREFLLTYRDLADNFPSLHIVMEHITTAEAVEFLEKYENVSATVTLHHLMITLDHVLGGLMQPHLFCKPVAKTPKDRQALRGAVFSGHEKIMFGSDSAPHPRHKKECVGCAAGVFTAPIALPLLAQIFEQADCLEHLQNFISGFAQKRYGLIPPQKSVHLTRSASTVPDSYGEVRPFYAGQEIGWSYLPSPA
jgi:dihydroorotase